MTAPTSSKTPSATMSVALPTSAPAPLPLEMCASLAPPIANLASMDLLAMPVVTSTLNKELSAQNALITVNLARIFTRVTCARRDSSARTPNVSILVAQDTSLIIISVSNVWILIAPSVTPLKLMSALPASRLMFARATFVWPVALEATLLTLMASVPLAWTLTALSVILVPSALCVKLVITFLLELVPLCVLPALYPSIMSVLTVLEPTAHSVTLLILAIVMYARMGSH